MLQHGVNCSLWPVLQWITRLPIYVFVFVGPLQSIRSISSDFPAACLHTNDLPSLLNLDPAFCAGPTTGTRSYGRATALRPQDTQKYTQAHLIDWATSTDIKTQCDKHWSWCSPYSTNRCTMVSCCCFQMISLVMTLKGPVHYKTTEIHPYPAICYRPMLASSVIELKLLLSNTLYTAWNDSSS